MSGVVFKLRGNIIHGEFTCANDTILFIIQIELCVTNGGVMFIFTDIATIRRDFGIIAIDGLHFGV